MQQPSSAKRIDLRRQRASAARERERARKSWHADAQAAVARSIWRLQSAWIEQASGAACAEFVHASSGKSLFVTVDGSLTTAERQTAVQQRLAIG